jgi:hypothetical protein
MGKELAQPVNVTGRSRGIYSDSGLLSLAWTGFSFGLQAQLRFSLQTCARMTLFCAVIRSPDEICGLTLRESVRPSG